MKTFETKLNEYYQVVLEQDAPPMQDAGAVPTPDASAMPGGAGAGGGAPAGGSPMGGDPSAAPAPAAQDMENETKREADPREYTRSILALLVDQKEGVTPEMFDDFIDSVSLAITKVKDKDGIKRFYGNFYKRLQAVLGLREELKSMFRQMSGTLEDLVGAQSEPDAAGGGVGKAGPTGPGVN
jgi:hypothetical protein